MSAIVYLAVSNLNSSITSMSDLILTALYFIAPLSGGIIVWRLFKGLSDIQDRPQSKAEPHKTINVLNDFPVDESCKVAVEDKPPENAEISSAIEAIPLTVGSIDLDKSKTT